MKDKNDENEARSIVETVCPDLFIRKTVLSIISQTIHEVNAYGRDKWAIRVEETVRFTVGHYYICTIGKSDVWLALDDRFLSSSEYYPTLEMLRAWGWVPDKPGDPGSYPTYKDRTMKIDFSVNGYYTIGAKHSEGWPHIRRLFFDFIYKAIYYGQSMDPRSPGLHSPGFLKYVRNELGVHLPDPLYC